MSRRFVLGAAGGLAAVTAGAGSGWAQAGLRVRPNVAALTVDRPTLATYRRAVQRMLALPTNDRRSWYQQARIHIDNCPHGNWFFLPWHREYLRRFEEIIRQVGEDPGFDLPFWDWNTDRQLPAAFWGDGNPLDPRNLPDAALPTAADPRLATLLQQFGKPRWLDQNGLVGNDIDFSLDTLLSVLGTPSFTDFASQPATQLRQVVGSSELESTLHGTVHVDVGGQMFRFFSPLDPIFWLHHANVDRLWTLWQQRNPAVVPPLAWRTFAFGQGMFVTGAGAAAPAVTCGELERVEPLGYAYEEVPGQGDAVQLSVLTEAASSPLARSAPAREARVFVAEGTARTSGRGFAALSVPLPDEVLRPLQLGETFLSGARPPRVTARIALAGLPKVPDAAYRVFLDCDYLTPSTPRADPHYATSLSLFGLTADDGHHQHADSAVFVVDLTRTVAALARAQRPAEGALLIQVQPEPVRGRESVESAVTLSRAEVVLA